MLFADLVGFTHALGVARPGGGARAALALLRHLPAADRAVRRHGREVHRRRGDGRLGDADRDRGRRRAGGSRGARPRRRRVGARREVGRAGAAGPRRRVDRRGGGHARRRAARGWSRAISSTPPRGSSRWRSRARCSSARRRGARPSRRSSTRTPGTYELKGKEGPRRSGGRCASSRASRGALKSQGLEAPFVGRDRELRQIKELFHACADEGKAQLVSVTGIAGIGKSRLGLGVLQVLRRDRRRSSTGTAAAASPTARASPTGRSPTWCGCAAGSPRTTSRARPLAKLRATLDEHIARRRGARGSSSRGWRSCSGSASRRRRDRQELFAAWRLFFERLADDVPDRARRSRTCSGRTPRCSTSSSTCSSGRATHPLFVITLARPELLERRPTWGAGQRNFTSLYLEPLPDAAMEELLAASSRACRTSSREQILARAEGVPLYAVETVRMLLDRGLLVRGGLGLPAGRARSRRSRCRRRCTRLSPRGSTGSRADERRLLQDAAVLGKTFTQRGARRARRPGRAELEPLLAALVRKEVLGAAGRSALAGARPVRLPAGPAPPGRLRDALPKRDRASAAPRRGRAPGGGARPRRRWPRWSPRTARRLPARPGRRRRRRDLRERRTRRCVQAGERAASLGARPRRSATSSRRPSSRPIPVSKRRPLREQVT